MNARLDIITVCYRTPSALVRLLESIPAALGRTRYTVTVVDTSETRELADADLPGDPPILTPGNVGYAGGLNHALEHGGLGAPLVCLCNADVRFPAGQTGLDKLLDLFRNHSRLGVVGPRQVNDQNRIVHAGFDVLGDTLGGRGFGRVDVGQFREPLMPCPQVSGSVMFVRRQALDAIGGRVPSPAFLYYEDTALCRDVAREGWTVAYSGLATFRHDVAASPEPDGRTRAQMAAEAREAWAASQEVTRR